MWHFLTTLLCFYGFVKEFKIGEPFIYLYQSETLNLTREQLTNEIYPYAAYTYLLSLIPVFLLTDLLLYKPTMMVEVIGQAVYRGALVVGGGVLTQKMGLMAYAMASASELAFFSYVYAKLEKEQFQKMTSYSRAATMAGRTLSYLLAQAIILTGLGTYGTLQWIGFGAACFVIVIAVILPPVHWEQALVRIIQSRDKGTVADKISLPQTYGAYVRYRLRLMRHDIFRIYRISAIRKWSMWWAMTTCMSLQVAQYAQALWGEVQHGASNPMNGFAEAAYTATAATSILILGLAKIDWDTWGELALVIISVIDTIVLVIYSRAQSIWTMYGCYIGYRSFYQMMITIAQWNLAKKMIGESYGLVFGLNSLTALLLQSLLTATVPDQRGLNMSVREQFLVYAGCHAFVGTVFLISMCYSFIQRCVPKVAAQAEKPGKYITP